MLRISQQAKDDVILLNVRQALTGKKEQIGTMSFDEALAAVSNEELALV